MREGEGRKLRERDTEREREQGGRGFDGVLKGEGIEAEGEPLENYSVLLGRF